jgi:type I restriction enzyme R subunit
LTLGRGIIFFFSEDYDREHALDWNKLCSFLSETQKKVFEGLRLDEEGAHRTQFLHRLQGEIAKRGIIDVLRNGIRHGQHAIDLFYGAPSEENIKAKELYEKNVFSVTRQLHYSKSDTQLSLDIAIFINGLPIATFELKNKLTKQTFEDAIQQYKRDRDPKELLFQFGRCAVHFAVDDHEVWMCTHLKGKYSWFLPFNKGYNDGAGNPPNPQGIATDYLWKSILKKKGITNIIENYAQIVVETDDKGRKRYKQIFPRYHQLDVVKKLLDDIPISNIGKRYLIQHSAGSGKSNSIAWLAHQLVGLKKGQRIIFDSVVVVTDRRILDKQIRDTIKQFAQVSAIVGHAERAGDLRAFLKAGKKIIITTVQKFPFVLSEIGDEHRSNKFAIIIDEAHSSQGGQVSAQMNVALAETNMEFGEDPEITIEDKINQLMEAKKMISNADYFAFTATPNVSLRIIACQIGFSQLFQIVRHGQTYSLTRNRSNML